MAGDDLILPVYVKGAPQAEAALDGVAKAVDEVGDQAKQTERELSRLSREISKTEAKMAALTAEFNRTGDSKFIEEFAKERKAAAGLREMQRELDRTEAKTRKLAKAEEERAKKLAQEAERQRKEAYEKSFTGRFASLAGRIPFVGGALSALGPQGTATIGLPLLGEAGGLVAAGGLLTAGLGTAIGGTVLAAKRNPIVGQSFGEVGKQVLGDLGDAADTFVDPLLNASKIFGDAWRKESVGVKGALADASKFVEPLATGFASMAHEFLPGFEAAVHAAGPVIQEFSTSFLPNVGRGIGELFSEVSHAAPGAVDSVHDLGVATKDLLKGFGLGVRLLSDFNHGLHQLDTFGGRTTSSLERTGQVLEAVGRGYTFLTTGSSPGPQFGHVATLVHKVAEEYHGLFYQAEQATKAIQDASNAMAGQLGNAVSLDEANLKITQDYADLKKAVQEHGHSLDDNTQSGRDNHNMIDQIVTDLMNQRAAAIAAGGGTRKATEDADAALRAQFAALEAWAIKLGFPRKELEKIFAIYLAILNAPPIHKSVTINTAGGGDTSSRGGKRALAGGGRALPGETYTVGEGGRPEKLTMFSDGSGGFVTPFQPAAAPSGGGGDDVLGVLVVRHVGPSGDQIRDELVTLRRRRGYTTFEAMVPG